MASLFCTSFPYLLVVVVEMFPPAMGSSRQRETKIECRI